MPLRAGYTFDTGSLNGFKRIIIRVVGHAGHLDGKGRVVDVNYLVKKKLLRIEIPVVPISQDHTDRKIMDGKVYTLEAPHLFDDAIEIRKKETHEGGVIADRRFHRLQ